MKSISTLNKSKIERCVVSLFPFLFFLNLCSAQSEMKTTGTSQQSECNPVGALQVNADSYQGFILLSLFLRLINFPTFGFFFYFVLSGAGGAERMAFARVHGHSRVWSSTSQRVHHDLQSGEICRNRYVALFQSLSLRARVYVCTMLTYLCGDKMPDPRVSFLRLKMWF